MNIGEQSLCFTPSLIIYSGEPRKNMGINPTIVGKWVSNSSLYLVTSLKNQKRGCYSKMKTFF